MAADSSLVRTRIAGAEPNAIRQWLGRYGDYQLRSAAERAHRAAVDAAADARAWRMVRAGELQAAAERAVNLAILALVGIVAAAVLWALGVSQRLWTVAGAALMLGAAGFACRAPPHLRQSRATTSPRCGRSRHGPFRDAVFRRPHDDSLASPAPMRGSRRAMRMPGDRAAARDRAPPGDATLWTSLGYVLALATTPSPSAKFAFRREMTLAPHTDGLLPRCLSMPAMWQSRAPWAYASQTPATAPYRADIAERIAAVDQFARMAAARRLRQPRIEMPGGVAEPWQHHRQPDRDRDHPSASSPATRTPQPSTSHGLCALP